MRFVFSGQFYILLALAIIPLSLSWNFPVMRYVIVGYDVLLLFALVSDLFVSRQFVIDLTINRKFDSRFAIGDPTKVSVLSDNTSDTALDLKLKDEYPPELTLDEPREFELRIGSNSSAGLFYHLIPSRRGKYTFGKTFVRFRSRLGFAWCQLALGQAETVKVYPNMRRAREMELKALGSRSFLAIQRRAIRRGEGREFESLRDYVRGDELRHISWTATARRSKLTTRQYQIERDQTVIVAIDAGRLMTGRIGNESKFETALHAGLALMSACSRAEDNCGFVIFGRRVIKYVPPKRGLTHIDAVLEAMYDIEPKLIEPSYPRAFQYIASNLKKRAFVVILTDVVDKESSAKLISSLKLLRPRHLPLVATIGDRDLNSTVSQVPVDIRAVFAQSAAEEIIHQRATALRMVESIGGLAIDVTTETLGPRLLESYLRVKKRSML